MSDVVARGHDHGGSERRRELQNTPANDLTPTALAERARELASDLDGLRSRSRDARGIVGRGMGAFAAVAQGSDQEPALITLTYTRSGASGPRLAYVGKAVTFDTGGISIARLPRSSR